jgi:HPt (histidine-containing phosphotransfer) domain-containing protein
MQMLELKSSPGLVALMTGVDDAAWSDFCDIFAGDMEAVSEIVTLFIDQSYELEAQLLSGFEKKDPDPIFRAGHSLKSTARQLGCLHLADLARDMEGFGKTKDLAAAAEIRAAFVAACEDARVALGAKL